MPRNVLGGSLGRGAYYDASRSNGAGLTRLEQTIKANQGIDTSTFVAANKLNFNKGNVIKYTQRAGKKPGVHEGQDLIKALDYLAMELGVIIEVVHVEQDSVYKDYTDKLSEDKFKRKVKDVVIS